MGQLSTMSLSFCEIKESAAFRAELAESIRKEKYSISYNNVSGTNGNKENTAIIQISEEVVVEALYNLISSLFKTKLDEIHRFIDVLKTILMSRNTEAKLNNNEFTVGDQNNG